MNSNSMDDVGPRISLADIEAFERTNSVKLPKEYAEFLLRSNGGIPVLGFFVVEGLDDMLWIDYLAKLPPASGKRVSRHGLEYDRLDELHRRYAAIVPEGTLVIGKACRDDLLLITTKGDSVGSVHVKMMEEAKAESARNASVYHVAPSFSRFFSSLVDDPEG